VTDGQTEMRWLRRAKAVAAFARDNEHCCQLSDFKVTNGNTICIESTYTLYEYSEWLVLVRATLEFSK